MASNYSNNNRVSAVLFRLIIAALLFTASYPGAHAQFGLGNLIPGLGGLRVPPLPVPPLPTLPPLPSLRVPPLPPSLRVPPLPTLPVPPLPSLPVPPLPTLPVPPLPIPSIPIPPVSPLPPLIPPQLPVGVNVTGRLCCSPDGNCPVQGGGQGVGGVPVILNCTFRTGTVTLGGGNTGVTGTFSIISFLPVVLDFLSTFFSTGGTLPCVAIVDRAVLNTVACPVLSTLDGALESLVNVTGMTINPLLQTIVNANATGFIFVPV